MKTSRTWFDVRYELKHGRQLRRLVLRIELFVRNIPHTIGGDAICVFVDGQWWELSAWERDRGWRPGGYSWVLDYPRKELDDESNVCRAIAWTEGFRFDVDQIPSLWERYQTAT